MDCRTHGNPQWLPPRDAKACKGTYLSEIRGSLVWGGKADRVANSLQQGPGFGGSVLLVVL